jgi:hypothetical protein
MNHPGSSSQSDHNPHRQGSFSSESSIAIGISEKEWEKNLEKHDTTSDSESIQEPEKVLTRAATEATASANHYDPEGHPVRRVVTAQDWTGPDDPENPHNWSLLKKIWHTIPPALFAFVVWVSHLDYHGT